MPKNPLAEVFGFPVNNFSAKAERSRKEKFCPYHNSSGPKCTKNSVKDPLGVCSVFEGDNATITCPVRFRQDWLIASDAAAFFFPPNTAYTSLTEVRLKDKNGKSAGNIDVVLVSFDDKGRVADFGALEVQAVYTSGNISGAFRHYMEDPASRHDMDWPREAHLHPDYWVAFRTSFTSRILSRGAILNAWGKKQAVALQRSFYEMLPEIPTVESRDADMAWLVYDLRYAAANNSYAFDRYKTVYSRFEGVHAVISKNPLPRDIADEQDFAEHLYARMEESIV